MKKVQIYVCDVCGTNYTNKEECQECENHHTRPVRIFDGTYLSKKCCPWQHVPVMLKVEFDNGEIAEYRKM